MDTHVIVRWLSQPNKLSREQYRLIRDEERREHQVALSAYSLIEIAMMASEGRHPVRRKVESIFAELETNPMFRILPITIPIAIDAGSLSILRDPADRTIVATARVHSLRLVTSDRRIVDSGLVSAID